MGHSCDDSCVRLAQKKCSVQRGNTETRGLCALRHHVGLGPVFDVVATCLKEDWTLWAAYFVGQGYSQKMELGRTRQGAEHSRDKIPAGTFRTSIFETSHILVSVDVFPYYIGQEGSAKDISWPHDGAFLGAQKKGPARVLRPSCSLSGWVDAKWEQLLGRESQIGKHCYTHGKHFGTESANQFPFVSYTDKSYPRRFLLHYGFNAWWVGKHALPYASRTAMYEGNLLQTCRSRCSVCHRLRRRQDVTWRYMRWDDMWHAGRDMTVHDVTRR